MYQKSPIALAQAQAGNILEKLLHKICQIIYSLYQGKKITKTVYSNIANLIDL